MGQKKEKVIRVVLDTNVLISALLFQGKLSTFVDLWKSKKIVPLITKSTFQELERTLHYPKFHLAESQVNALIQNEILPYFEVIEEKSMSPMHCQDQEDVKFVVCALSGKADYLVSGDSDLLGLSRLKTLRIAKPADFLRKFSE